MTTYTILNGKLTLCGKHYKSTEDALWLTGAVTPSKGSKVLDVGAGNGAIGFALQAIHGASVTLIEKSPKLIESLRAARQMNGIEDAQVIHCAWPESLKEQSYDYIVSNPPFHLFEQGFESSSKQNRHGISKEDLLLWVNSCYKACTHRGEVALFLSTKAFECLHEALLDLGLKAITEIITSADKPAKGCIVELSPAHKGLVERFALNAYEQKIREDVLKQGGKIKAHRLARP